MFDDFAGNLETMLKELYKRNFDCALKGENVYILFIEEMQSFSYNLYYIYSRTKMVFYIIRSLRMQKYVLF